MIGPFGRARSIDAGSWALGPLLAGIVALAASLPALSLPFLADDWANLLDVSAGQFTRTAFGYFRPLYLATLWLDLHVWGRSPFAFHATNVALIALAAALVVLVAKRYGATPGVATLAGVAFALHPFHVETAAWIAARGDALYCVSLLLAFLAYDGWTNRSSPLPFLSLLWFEVALLCKEAAVAYPLLLLVLRFGRPDGPLSRREIWRGLTPHALVALAHFFIVRKIALAGTGVFGPSDLGIRWVKRFVNFLTASVLPLHIERIDGHPRTIGLAAAFVVALLFLLARRRLGDDWKLLATFGLGFVIASGPSLLSFQERYLFFPSVFSSVVVACLLAHVQPRPRALLLVALISVWGASLWEHWSCWTQAGGVSRTLVAGLTNASLDPEVTEIVVANMPYRVHGAPVAGALPTAVEFSGGRKVAIRAATSVDLPTCAVDGLDDDGAPSGSSPDDIRIRLASGLFARVFLPLRQEPGVRMETDFGAVTFEAPGVVHVRLDRRADGSRRAFVWRHGALEKLF